MDMTYYAEFNETTRSWELYTDDDVLIASFVGFESGWKNLAIFCKASDEIKKWVFTC